MTPPRILIAGGGTGGHIIPALAVARELVARYNAEILFVGTARGLESRLVPAAGFQLKLIEVGPLNKVSLATRLHTLVQLPLSLLACFRILRQFRADAVLGVGGYASGPAMGAAILRGTPAMAFEPNAVPGMANRLIGKRVQAAAVNFPPAAKWFRNVEVTGIPVRPEFFTLTPPPDNAPPHLLIFGGSQGARLFNILMPQLAPELLEAVPGLTLLHQAGARQEETTRAAYQASGADPSRWRVEAFLDNMAEQFARAHLVMARSGASTVAELAAAGKPSLLIPFAAAADNHQRSNAEVMVAAGAAVMLEERQLNPLGKSSQPGQPPNPLLRALESLLANPARLEKMGEKARTQAHPAAAEHIADRLASLIQHQKPNRSAK
jgi:UDP-N-acetylglucosamine--N-acetylmuramyl-(pentapeptide) pyrophosphoryl-undecaprenol N-acetylglucosamine transferase